MSIFDWQAKDTDSVVSSRIWIYVVIATLLTVLVLVIWIWWFKLSQEKYKKEYKKEPGNDMEIADSQMQSKRPSRTLVR